MKSFTFLITLCLISITAWSEKSFSDIHEKSANLFLKNDNLKKHLPDSTIYRNSFGFNISKSVFTYDTEGYTTVEKKFAGVGNKWIKSNKSTWEYDANKNITLIESYEAEGDEWIPVSREEFTFNENSDLTSNLKFIWENEKWTETDKKYIYTYDENFNQLTQEIFIWGGRGWINSELYSYSYKDNRMDKYSKFNWEDDDWLEVQKADYIYENNKIIEAQQLFYKANQEWFNARVIEKTFDDQGNLIEDYAYLNMDYGIVGSYRIIYAYDDNNNQTLYEMYMYTVAGWSKVQMIEKEFDEFGYLLSQATYFGNNEEWTISKEDIYIYGDTGVQSIEHYNTSSGVLEIAAITDYYYPKQGVGINYPTTPDSQSIIYIENQTLYIQSPYTEDKIDIYSSTGMKIYTGNSKKISLSELQKGIIIIKSNNGWGRKVIVP